MPCSSGIGPAWCGARLALLLLLLTGAGSAAAAGLQVAPTTVEIPAARQAGGLYLTNTGPDALHAQVRVFRWTQEGGEDRLESATELAVSPPMLEIPAGAEQLVRVVRLGPAPAAETSFRLVVDELPLEEAGAEDDDGAQLRFVLRYSIPVFLGPQGGAVTAPVLRARLGGAAASLYLEVHNSGDGRAQLSDLAHVDGGGTRRVVAAGLAGYVLPGRERRWMLPPGIPAGEGSFQARINGEVESRALALDR